MTFPAGSAKLRESEGKRPGAPPANPGGAWPGSQIAVQQCVGHAARPPGTAVPPPAWVDQAHPRGSFSGGISMECPGMLAPQRLHAL